ncbi:cAMP-specific 3',5'-cyclic phosphodiesterase 4C, partial [Nowakowskiella sp. JEL0078]
VISNFDPLNTREDRTLLLQMIIKCADVSNPTKAWPLYEEWIHRIIAEWYVQGDKERELGLPISAYCDRYAPPAPPGQHPHQSSQQGFIEFIVAPMFEALASWTDIEVIRMGLDTNRSKWSPKSETRPEDLTPTPTTPSNSRSTTSIKNAIKRTSSFGNGIADKFAAPAPAYASTSPLVVGMRKLSYGNNLVTNLPQQYGKEQKRDS